VLELIQSLLNRQPTDAHRSRYRITVDPVAGAQLSGQHQVDDEVDDQIFLFEPVFLRHLGA